MSKVDEFYKKCATCNHYGLGNTAKCKPGFGYYCHEKQNYYQMNDGCNPWFGGGYSRNPKVKDKDIEEAEKLLNKKDCFITTAICEILQFEDDCPTLKTLRGFREYYLKNSPQYFYILKHYDEIGPQIAESLRNDKNRIEVARDLFKNKISVCCQLIAMCQYDRAIEAYIDMTNNLANRYGIENTFNKDTIITSKEARRMGHGRKLIKK